MMKSHQRARAGSAWLCAATFALFFFATSIYIAQHRLLWFDELGTLKIAKLQTLVDVWRVQTSAIGDSAPIVYQLAARAAYEISGHNDLSIRILSALALSLGLLVVFDCTRRMTAGLYGLIAMCVVGGSLMPYYGYEGRPYALAFLFTASALWLWLHTAADSKRGAAAFGAAVFFALMMHFNMVLILVPFGLWELIGWKPWRAPSLKLSAGVIGLVLAFALSLPQMRANAGLSASSWCPPSIPALTAVYSELFPDALAVLALLILAAGVYRRNAAQPMTDREQVCWLFLAIPIAGYVLAKLVTNAFYNRYLVAAIPGVAVAAGCLFARCLPKRASVAILLILSAVVAHQQIRDTRHADLIEPASAKLPTQYETRTLMEMEPAILADGATAIVTDFVGLSASRYYSTRPSLYVLYGPETDPSFCQYHGAACWNSADIIARAPRVAALHPTDPMFKDMKAAGYEATVKTTTPLVVYFTRR